MKKISIILLTILVIIFVNNNHFLYSRKIVKVENVYYKYLETETNDLGIKEKYYKQKLICRYLNSKDKNKKVTLYNKYSTSKVYDEEYRVGDELILDKDELILKRDKYLAYLLLSLFILLTYIGKKKGVFAFISSIISIVVFLIGISLYKMGINLYLITILELILLPLISLLIVGGKTKLTISSLLSTYLSTILFMILTSIFYLTKLKGINFQSMAFLTIPPEDIFIPSILISSLGAVMDISMTITSACDEMVRLNNKIKIDEMISSCKTIGKDILPTMINVLFYTYLCSTLSVFVLAIRNGYSVYNYITENYTLELLRFILGSISLIIAIPSSIFIGIKVYRRSK